MFQKGAGAERGKRKKKKESALLHPPPPRKKKERKKKKKQRAGAVPHTHTHTDIFFALRPCCDVLARP